MNNYTDNNKSGLTIFFSAFLFIFYIAIVGILFFVILHINQLENFTTGIIFEGIGLVLTAYFLFSNALGKPIKSGFFLPLLLITILYAVVVNLMNLWIIVFAPHVIFLLAHLIVLFVYCLICAPMYIMGRK